MSDGQGLKVRLPGGEVTSEGPYCKKKKKNKVIVERSNINRKECRKQLREFACLKQRLH